jgi:GAF domain-containing protein
MRSAEEAPFGLDPVQPAFDRATRLAKLLFGAADSTILLIDGDRVWRSRSIPNAAAGYRGAPHTSPAHEAMATGQLVWVADAAADPKYAEEPSVAKFGLRFYAAAPVRLDDGTTPGVITVFGLKPRSYDDALAKGLDLLAAGVAEECNRARAAAGRGAQRRGTGQDPRHPLRLRRFRPGHAGDAGQGIPGDQSQPPLA